MDLKGRFAIEREIEEMDEEESSYLGSGHRTVKPRRVDSPVSSSSHDSVSLRLQDRSERFKKELRAIKDMVLSSSEEKPSRKSLRV